MDSYSAGVGWTDDQWNRVQKAVVEEAQKARVAASFLPLTGPVDGSTVAIPNFTLAQQAVPGALAVPGVPPVRFTVDSDPTLFLTTLSTLVYVRGAELADPEMGAALGMFRRAATAVARLEDGLVFRGRPAASLPPPLPAPIPIVAVTGNGATDGLLPFGVPAAPVGAAIGVAGIPPRAEVLLNAPIGPSIVPGVANAIAALEAVGHSGPFACVLAMDLFTLACSPTGNLVMPRDRVLPFLDGQLYRSSALPAGYGLVIALGGAPIELVVASDICVKFLHATEEPRHVFRVSERVALRAKELTAVAVLHT